MQYATLAVSRIDGEYGSIWTLADNDGPIASTRERDTARVWEHYLDLSRPPLASGELVTNFPRAEGDKLVDMLVICRDGFIRRR